MFAHGYEEDALTDTARLTASDLDEAVPDRPLWVMRVDYHSAVVNHLAQRRLAIPVGTRGLLAERGQPLGILRSDAYLQGRARVSRQYPLEMRERAVRVAAERPLAGGITSVHALEGGRLFGDEGVDVLLRRLEHLPLDVTVFLQEQDLPFITRLGLKHLGGCILLDGSIGSYSAALDDDYEGRHGSCGVLYERSRDLDAFVSEAHAAGIQLAFHAIGPRAVGQVLDAYERAQRRAPRYDHRHRIEHAELITDDQLARARDLGVVRSMQPAFEHFWGGPSGMYAARLGERWRHARAGGRMTAQTAMRSRRDATASTRALRVPSRPAPGRQYGALPGPGSLPGGAAPLCAGRAAGAGAPLLQPLRLPVPDRVAGRSGYRAPRPRQPAARGAG